MAQSGHGLVHCTGLLSTQRGHVPKTVLVERATESRDGDSHRNQHQHKHRDCIVVQVGKVRAFEHDRA
jgi:hypothetical protein